MKSPPSLRPGELAFALLLLGFSLAAFYEAYQISGFTGLTTGGAMPMTAAAVMIVSGLFIVKDTLARRGGPAPSLRETAAFLVPPRLLIFTALLIAYAAAIPWAGFVAASSGFLLISIMLLWRRGPWWAAGVTLIAMAAIYLIFRLGFQVVLPMGTLWR
ncbi:MAG: tripartite tricarboxylate transporter TctB family protein [Rhodobacteraceae bacterium]|nr:tripartite tricarboxylate transporter TctB family protein [Paracoccaceae bacterium]